ncbi:MAG TPA: DnaJ C-terminal domain-containing protein, partial [Terracidiphilus sp.]
IEIDAIDGAVSLKVPEGTQSGKELRVRGRGVPLLNGKGKGDLLVTVVVQVPKKLTKMQREMMRQLEDSLKIENKPAAPSFMDKMKDLFS